MKKLNIKFIAISVLLIVATFTISKSTVIADLIDYPYTTTYTVSQNPAQSITVTLSANPDSMTLPTNQTTLTWSTTGSPDSCNAFEGSGSTSWQGSHNTSGGSEVVGGLTPAIYTFGIFCTKAGLQGVAGYATVVVSPVAGSGVTASLAAIPNGYGFGGGLVQLKWGSSLTATSCKGLDFSTGNGVGQPGPTTGITPAFQVSTTTTYHVTCTDGISTAPAQATVVIGPKDPDSTAVTVTLFANPITLPFGGGTGSDLTWTSTNATSCSSANFSVGGLTGTTHVSPTVTGVYHYTIKCTNGVPPDATAQATVVVLDKDGQCTGPDCPPIDDKFECNDDIDNDGDKLIDEFDPGCHTDGIVIPGDELNTYVPTDPSEKNGIKIKEKEI